MNHQLPQDDFLAKWLNGELTEAEQLAWEADAEHEELRRLVDTAGQLTVPATQSKADAWEKFQANIESEGRRGTGKVVRFSNRLFISSVAAAAAIMLIALYFFNQSPAPVVYRTLAGESLNIELPDGSDIALNSLSSLTVDTANWSQNRQVQLEGEAFFEVEKGSRFLVTTNRGNVQVLGTSFNVKARPELWEVACFSGRVSVSDPQNDEELLLPGESVMQQDSRLVRHQFTPLIEELWTNGRYNYVDAPFEAVVAEMERQFGVKIEYQATKQHLYTGGFETNSLEDALNLTCGPMQFNVIFEGGQLVRIESQD
ncbi:MAG: FecR family protein [Bacteroidota bacterium]